MTTESKILANRLNSQKSTGPRTIEGKAVVSQNAVKHGLLAERDVISSENPADFDLYRQQLLDELSPVSPLESMLAERIITLSWRLKRACRFQNQAIDVLNEDQTAGPLKKLTRSLYPGSHHHSQDAPSASDDPLALGRLAVKDFSDARVLDRLLMYERRIENSLYKTLLEFQRLHLIKKMDTESENKATPTLSTSDKRPATYDTRPATYDMRPATYDIRPATYDTRPATCDIQPTKDKLCETNPIPQKPKVNLNLYSSRDYENKSDLLTPEKQTQFYPEQAQRVEGLVVSEVEPTNPIYPEQAQCVEGFMVSGPVPSNVEGVEPSKPIF